METKRIVLYLNQFFGQIGGEDKADIAPQSFDKPIGPGVGLASLLPKNCTIVGTIVCGDSYFNENLDEASNTVRKMLEDFSPHVVIAGPAFNAGRYGMACGTVGKIAQEMGVPAVSGMYPENPGVESYRQYLYIVETGNSAASMRNALPSMARLTGKLANNEPIGSPAEEGYLSRGIRTNVFVGKRGSERAIDMLLKKISGETFQTEYPIPHFDRVDPAEAITDLSKVTVALVTSGGIVPKGNPDRIEASSASRYGKYSIEGLASLTSDSFETAHGGYDPVYANQAPDRVVPVDALRVLEKEGKIGKLFPYFYATVGNGTSVANAKKYASEIAHELVNEGVQAVILTSTWGTCTRCGATMVKEIERVGITVVHVCTVTPISLTVGANRIVPAVAIPYPLGNPKLTAHEEFHLRKKLVEQALNSLTQPVSGQTVFENWVV